MTTVADAVDRVVQLIDSQIELAQDQSEAIRIVESEWRNLPDKEAAVLRRASQQSTGLWVEAVAKCRPDLDPGAVETTVHAVFAMINSITRVRTGKSLSPSQRERLREMAIASVFGQTTPLSLAQPKRNPRKATSV